MNIKEFSILLTISQIQSFSQILYYKHMNICQTFKGGIPDDFKVFRINIFHYELYLNITKKGKIIRFVYHLSLVLIGLNELILLSFR